MATPATGATAPLAPSLDHRHAHNIDRCDDPMQKNGSCQNSSSPISASLLSGKIVANALRPFLGKANEYGAGGNSSATGSEGSTPIQDHSFSPRSGLDILNSLNIHDNAAARKLVELAEQQQREVGDGTKTAVILAGSILDAAERLMKPSADSENDNSMSPSEVSSAFVDAADYAVEVMKAHSSQVDIASAEQLQTLCHHYLSSSFSSGSGGDDAKNAKSLAKLTIGAILKLDEQNGDEECLPDLDKIRIVREISGNVEESGVFSGLILKRPESGVGGDHSNSTRSQVPGSAVSVVTSTTEAAPKSLESGDVKVCFVEYWLSPLEIPTDCDEETREEMLREDRRRLLSDCKQIKKSGAKVVLIAAKEVSGEDEMVDTNDAGGLETDIDVNLQICLHFLAKMGIMAISGLGTDQISEVIELLGGMVIPFPENISLQELGSAKQVHEVKAPSGTSWIHFEGTRTPAATIMLHGPTEASIDASKYTIDRILSFVGNLFRDPHVVAGGGATEIEASLRLRIQSTAAADDVHSQCMRAFAGALEVIPYTLAENSDINPAAVVTALRRQHAEGQTVIFGVALHVKRLELVREAVHDDRTVEVPRNQGFVRPTEVRAPLEVLR